MEDRDVIKADIIAELNDKVYDMLEEKGLNSSIKKIIFLRSEANKEINKLIRGDYDTQIGQFIDICLNIGLKPEIKYSIINSSNINTL